MNEQFIPYEQALELKKLGFNEKCFKSYRQQIKHEWYDLRSSENIIFNEDEKIILSNGKIYSDEKYLCDAPLWQQAFDWFREKHGLCYFINHSGRGYCSGWEDLGNNEHGFGNYSTYEEARIECLKKLIELCKNVK